MISNIWLGLVVIVLVAFYGVLTHRNNKKED